MQDESLEQRVVLAIEGDTAFEPVWDALGEAIAAAPGDAALLRLRIAMADAAGLQQERWADLRRLVALLPGEREARHALAALQHDYAGYLVDDTLDEAAQERETERLQQQARDAFEALAIEQQHDADFVQGLFEGDHPLQTQPWRRTRLLLRAAAAAPSHVGLARLLALGWADLAGWAPRDWDGEEPFPMGFQFDGFGNLFEPLMVQRALDALAPLLARSADDEALLSQRAAMLVLCGRFDEAAADCEARAAVWSSRAAHATDDDTREHAHEQAAQAQQEADRCRAGRAGVLQGMLDSIGGGMQRLLDGLGAGPETSEDLSAEQRALLDELRAGSAQRREQLDAAFDELRPQLEAAQTAPDEAALAALEALAQDVARKSGGLVSFDPVLFVPRTLAELASAPDPWLDEVAEPLRTHGWRPVGLCEDPAWRQHFGQPVISSLWVDAAGTSVAVFTAAGALRVIDLEIELADGTQFITNSARGRSNYGSVTGIDQLAVDAELPVVEQAGLHQARLAWHLARHPAAVALPVDSVARFAAMQERQRQLKLAYRLGEGLSEFEALGMPTDHPEHFVPAVRRAVRDELRRLARARGMQPA